MVDCFKRQSGSRSRNSMVNDPVRASSLPYLSLSAVVYYLLSLPLTTYCACWLCLARVTYHPIQSITCCEVYLCAVRQEKCQKKIIVSFFFPWSCLRVMCNNKFGSSCEHSCRSVAPLPPATVQNHTYTTVPPRGALAPLAIQTVDPIIWSR